MSKAQSFDLDSYLNSNGSGSAIEPGMARLRVKREGKNVKILAHVGIEGDTPISLGARDTLAIVKAQPPEGRAELSAALSVGTVDVVVPDEMMVGTIAQMVSDRAQARRVKAQRKAAAAAAETA